MTSYLFLCLSQRSKYGFPFLLSSPGTTPFICFLINPVYLVFVVFWHFNWHWLKCCFVLRLAEGLWPGSFQTKHSGAYCVRQRSKTSLLAVAGLTAGKLHLEWHRITQCLPKEEVSDARFYFCRFVPEAANIMFMCVEGLWSIRIGFWLLLTASRSKANP